MTLDEAIHQLRADPAYRDQVRDAFLGPDALDSAKRFAASEEFAAVLKIVAQWVENKTVLDLGAGVGISSYAFAIAGAKVIAVEPDMSENVGRGAAQRVIQGLPIEYVDAFGESMPVPNESVDLVYTRQVLHHTSDLKRTLKECARVLKPGGAFLACREHVLFRQEELKPFLDSHIVHQLAGGENAYLLREYIDAIEAAPLTMVKVLGLFDSVINSYPRTERDRLQVHTNALPSSLRLFGYLPCTDSNGPEQGRALSREADSWADVYLFCPQGRLNRRCPDALAL